MARQLVRLRPGAFKFVGVEQPDPTRYFWSDDPLVKQYPWAFATDMELAADQGLVESATAVPGEKRTVTRPAQ